MQSALMLDLLQLDPKGLLKLADRAREPQEGRLLVDFEDLEAVLVGEGRDLFHSLGIGTEGRFDLSLSEDLSLGWKLAFQVLQRIVPGGLGRLRAKMDRDLLQPIAWR